ncbi:MAG TPA: methyltransferase domain-containing protein [Thermoanaerobaculia bacterium]|nr:methyltransferase domain-containing protein [Thermoanaerobaculia bacterium]
MTALSTTDPYVAFTRRFFGRWSPVYDLFAKPIGFAYEAAVSRAGAAPGRTILDLCTGTGEIAIRCARRGAKVTAVDLTPSMFTRAERKARSLPVDFAGMDARHLAFPDATFDAVLLSFALHDMPRKVRTEVLHEAARVAREKVVILDYDVPQREPWHTLVRKGLGLFETPYLQAFAKQGGAKGAIEEAGLEIRETARPARGLFVVYEVSPAGN